MVWLAEAYDGCVVGRGRAAEVLVLLVLDGGAASKLRRLVADGFGVRLVVEDDEVPPGVAFAVELVDVDAGGGVGFLENELFVGCRLVLFCGVMLRI